MRCSECGYVAKRERKLYKARRRWKVAFLGVFLLLIGAYALKVTPAVNDRGWVAAVPTTVLILALPWYESLNAQLIARWPRSAAQAKGWSTLDICFYELMHHRGAIEGDMSRLHRRMILRRCISGDSARPPLSSRWALLYGFILRTLERHPNDEALWRRADELVDLRVHTREMWPVGVPIHAGVAIRKWRVETPHYARIEPLAGDTDPLTVEDGGLAFVCLGTPDPGDLKLRFHVAIHCAEFLGAGLSESRQLREYLWEPNIQIGGTIDDYIRPVDDAELGAQITTMLAPLLRSNSRVGDFLSLPYEVAVPDGTTPRLRETTLGFSIEVVRDGELVGVGHVCYQPVHHAADEMWTLRQVPPGVSITLEREHSWPQLRAAHADASHWTLRMIGSPEIALRHFEGTHYWAGTIEIPLSVEFEE